MIYQGKWLGIKNINYSIGDTKITNYEALYRTTTKKGQIDGIDIIPIIQYKDKPSELVMIIEFRPPIKGYAL